jgi:AcrR family transcriptional regulator
VTNLLTDSRKEELATRILEHLTSVDRPDITYRGLAKAAGVSRPTLVHHFGGLENTLSAVFELAGRRGAHWHNWAQGLDGDPAAVLTETVTASIRAWHEFGVGRLHALGLLTGLEHDHLGSRYLQVMFEPTVALYERLLTRFAARGDLHVDDPRHAALRLFGPLFVVLLHQHHLGGCEVRPLDIEAFAADHVARFLRAHQAVE